MSQLKEKFNKLRSRIQAKMRATIDRQKRPSAWKGACLSLALITTVLFTVQIILLMQNRSLPEGALLILLLVLAVTLASALVALLHHLLKKIPSPALWVILIALVLILLSFIGSPVAMVLLALIIIVTFAVIGAAIYTLRREPRATMSGRQKILTHVLFPLAILSILFFSYQLFFQDGAGDGTGYVSRSSWTNESYREDFGETLEDPSAKGAYPTKSLTYGAPDTYRSEFTQADSLVTYSVDASAGLENWTSARTRTFGFGPNEMPLNGTITYPDAEGTFPLVILVHGNHMATDYSDTGYTYLTELLASRGYIVVSIDENFLNMSTFDDWFFFKQLEGDNQARAIVLLEHLKLWEGWNEMPGHLFFGKVDLENIALIGHSRGGEAVSLAALYNQLGALPGDGNQALDYHFGIRSVISLSGTDSQFLPSGLPVTLEDINYLSLHGSNDMDVMSYEGQNQFHRINLTEGSDCLKAQVFINGANHGQFNTNWGIYDGFGLGNQLSNTAAVMPAEDQQKIAQVFISAFLDTILKGQDAYSAIFRDASCAQTWLPDTLYFQDYEDSRTFILADFSEDMDPTSTSAEGGVIDAQNLKTWSEEMVPLKLEESDYKAVRLAWDSSQNGSLATYSLKLPEVPVPEFEGEDFLILSVADARVGQPDSEDYLDFTLEVQDRAGNHAAIPLSRVRRLWPPLEGKITKWPFPETFSTTEPVFSYFQIPLAAFREENASFAPEELQELRLVFDQTESGAIYLGKVGVWQD